VHLSLGVLAQTARSLEGLLGQMQKAAASEAPVLIVGESGSGRSTLARGLHAASARAAAPLVEVDPSVLPSGLFESELFGHRSGAFTGAQRTVPGRVELAAGGTLVLDHVEEIPVAAQPKLLRLLAERRYAPLGGAECSADVRFVAIGAEDLPRRVAEGTFRGDLFYRLEVLTFRLPPLRERAGDLAGLTSHFLTDLAERFGRPPLELSDQARRWMTDYSWPGNLRQLRNVLERALILGSGTRLDPPPPQGAEGRPRTLQATEEEEIRRALAYTRGHQGRAAELLGISRKSLWQRRRRFGIP